MSEQKLVSPLLDGFQMGEPISSHDGVRCCPAIRENSDNKYIIKILSIPASQSQLDALLLTGAFQDAAGALNYFKELTDGVVQEIRLHQKLARMGGFVPCEAWQVVPMDNNSLGYDVYLLTPYRRTLDRYLKKNTMTHLEAVNLGLDLCAALTACRRAGHLYVDLKPSNIFISDDKNYLIGDLGFISLDSIQYAALPSKYRSCYSAPELHDVFATINSTADTYSLGLILYQVYNDGALPFENQPPMEELAPPANADEEMKQIIMKACHPDPAQRWQDPTEMGQALVAYMQRNTINDVPILPPVVEETPEEEPEQEEDAPVEAPEAEVPAAEEDTEESPAEAAEETVSEETEEQEPATQEEESDDSAEEAETEEAEETSEESAAEETVSEEVSVGEESSEETVEEAAQEEAPAEVPAEEETQPEETVAEEAAEEETAPAQLSDDIDDILAHADELVAHEVPAPVVVPEIQLPEQPAPEAEPAAEEPVAVAEDEEDVETPLPIPEAPKKKKGKKIIVTLVTFLLLAALGFGAKYYYDNYYLIPVTSITLEGGVDQITAQVVVNADESLLTAICTDTYGNTTTAPVQNGVAQFTGLKAGSRYTVSLDIEGFNQLCGNNSATFTTENQTNIVSFTATTGAEDGAVILSFTVDGTDPANWTVEYAAEGQDAQTMNFTGHMVTINGLEVDTAYTFRLYPTEETDVALVGTDTLEFTVSKVLLAQNIVLASFTDGTMDIAWEAPADLQVEQWTVRCTDGGSFDQTVTVTDCTAQFTGAELGKTYTVEVLASGMTQSARAEVTPKELAVTTVNCTPMGSSSLRVTWEYEGEAPAAGWAVTYSINGSKSETITSDTNAADISPLIPGASYEVTVAGISASYETAKAEKFASFGITADDFAMSLCETPKEGKWDYSDVSEYTRKFSTGDSISAVVYLNEKADTDSADVDVLYVVRDSKGNIIIDLCHAETMDWKNMWDNRYFYPTLPKAPTASGTYTMELYFNGALALSKEFTIL